MTWSYTDFENLIGKEVIAIRNPYVEEGGFAYSLVAPYDGKMYRVKDYHQSEYDAETRTFIPALELEDVAGGPFPCKYFRVL